MTLCSVYMAMLLTNWGDSEDAEPTRRYNLGVASAWVQVRMERDLGEICLGERCLRCRSGGSEI